MKIRLVGAGQTNGIADMTTLIILRTRLKTDKICHCLLNVTTILVCPLLSASHLGYLLAEGKNKDMVCDTPIVSMILTLIMYVSPTFPLARPQTTV